MKVKFSWYCTCGDSAHGSVAPAEKLPKLKALWESAHTGEGHAPCDAKTAARARAKENRRLAKAAEE